MVQEANPLRPNMAPNIAEPILGGIYDLFADALGGTVAWWLGHLTLFSIIALGYWAITNWNTVTHGLGITKPRVVAWLALFAFTGLQVLLFRDQMGFPTIGAFFTAGSISLYIWWQWYQIEPQKA